MSEIDVSKCEFYNYGVCSANNIYADGELTIEFQCSEIQDCYYKQLQQLKAKNKELKKDLKELKKDLKNVEKDRAWIKERCIDAGKELGKYSFAWDGKEKNLVVQAMELNEMYEQLKAENEELEKELRQKKMTILMNNDHYFEVDQTNKKLKAERDLLLKQLVILDGEDVTVQVTQEQFEEYNKLKAENEKLRFPREDIDFAVLTKEEFENYNKLKAENETLNTLFKNYKKEYINSTNKLGEMVLKNGNLYNEKEKYKHILDEIEEICKTTICDYPMNKVEEIMKLIKQVKEVKGE